MALDFLTGCFGWRPSKLGRCNEKCTRVWIWSLKILLVIPVAIAAFGARAHYRDIQRHPELSQSPYNEKAELAFFLTYIPCITIFPWIFASSAALLKFQGPWILLYGIIDFGLAITLAIGVGMQGEFLPTSFISCDKGKADHWQVVGDQKSLFTLAAEFAGGKANARSECRRFVSDWTTAVSALFFQMLVSYVGIFFDEREFSILNPMRPIVWLIVIIIGPPIMLHDYCFPRIRLWFSYLKKLVGRPGAKRDLKIPPQIQFKPPRKHFHNPDTKLMHILVIEHVLLNVADHMHMEDVINLSLTCRAVREVVYPRFDLEHRIPKLKKRCCDPDSKSGCLYCNKRICLGCKKQAFLPGLPGRRHVVACQPYCRACYYKHFARHPRGYKRPCKCHAADRSAEDQDVCRTCFIGLNPTTIQTTRHKRYQQQARDMAFGIGEGSEKMQVCGSCKKELEPGTRWWVCGRCTGECRDGIHPPYVGKRKERDVEKAEGVDREREEVEPWWRKLRALCPFR